MKKELLLAGITCATFMNATSFAAPPPELENYRWAVGQYSCAGETRGEGSHSFTATFSLTRALNGGVYVERYVEAKSAQHPNPFSVMYLWTYDTQNKRYVRNGVDGDGGRYEQTATGWNDGVWIWDAGGFRIPITREGDNQFSFRAELLKDGDWVQLASGTCKK